MTQQKLIKNFNPHYTLVKVSCVFHILVIMPVFYILCLLFMTGLNTLWFGRVPVAVNSSTIAPLVINALIAMGIFAWYNFAHIRLFYLIQKFDLTQNPTPRQYAIREKIRRNAVLTLNFLCPLIILLLVCYVYLRHSFVLVLAVLFSMWCTSGVFWGYQMHLLTNENEKKNNPKYKTEKAGPKAKPKQKAKHKTKKK